MFSSKKQLPAWLTRWLSILKQQVEQQEFELLLAKERSDSKMTKTDALIHARRELNEGRRKLAVDFVLTMRAELIGHFKPCVTEIYLHI